jgi:hypothetical protein
VSVIESYTRPRPAAWGCEVVVGADVGLASDMAYLSRLSGGFLESCAEGGLQLAEFSNENARLSAKKEQRCAWIEPSYRFVPNSFAGREGISVNSTSGTRSHLCISLNQVDNRIVVGWPGTVRGAARVNFSPC